MTSVRNAVATRDDHQPTVGSFIQQLRPEIQRALPKGMDADRIARLALTVVRKDQNLARCKPESFAGALLTASALGLEPGVNGEAYLVAYKGECTLIVGYQGYAKLFWQHPAAQHLDAQAVHEHDDFDYAYGLDPFLRHKPGLGDRGKVVAFYAVATIATGTGSARMFVVLSPEEVKALRGGKSGSGGGIADPMHWMERKTVLRQLFKLLPKSTTLQQAIDSDEKTGRELAHEREIVEGQTAPAAIEPPPAPPVETVTGVVEETAADTGEAASDAQMKKLHALLGEIGLSDRDARLEYLTEQLGRPVTTSKSLSKTEASTVIDRVDKFLDPSAGSDG